MKTYKTQLIISIVTCFSLILAVTICKEKKFQNTHTEQKSPIQASINQYIKTEENGVQILSTQHITKDIVGYGGSIPLEIHIKDHRIVRVVALENAETPSYFAKVRNSNILEQWNGLTLEKAIQKRVDAVSGATRSSVALKLSVQKALKYAQEHLPTESTSSMFFDWRLFVILLTGIILCVCITPYFLQYPRAQTSLYVLNIVNLSLALSIAALSIQPNSTPVYQKPTEEFKEATSAALDNIYARTSIRSFLPQKVEEEKIEQLLRAAMAAPTAGNKQPWDFVVIKERKTLDTLAAVLPYAQMTKEAPLAIVVCGNLEKALSGEAAEYWVQDASAATENLLLAAQDLGLGAVWTGVYPISERVKLVQGILQLPQHILPLNVIPIGYPAENPLPKDKWKPANIHYEHWKEQ